MKLSSLFRGVALAAVLLPPVMGPMPGSSQDSAPDENQVYRSAVVGKLRNAWQNINARNGVVDLTIDKSGKLLSSEFLTSTGDVTVDSQALAALQKLTFPTIPWCKGGSCQITVGIALSELGPVRSVVPSHNNSLPPAPNAPPPWLAQQVGNLAQQLFLSDDEDADQLLRCALRIDSKQLNRGGLGLVKVVDDMVHRYQSKNQFEKAESLSEYCLSLLETKLGPAANEVNQQQISLSNLYLQDAHQAPLKQQGPLIKKSEKLFDQSMTILGSQGDQGKQLILQRARERSTILRQLGMTEQAKMLEKKYQLDSPKNFNPLDLPAA